MKRDNNARKIDYFHWWPLSSCAIVKLKPKWNAAHYRNQMNSNLVKICKSSGYGLCLYFLGLSYTKTSNLSVIIDCSI